MFELEPYQSSSQTSKIKIYSEAFMEDDELQINFILEDKNNIVAMEKDARPERTHELWKTTCFEAFFGVKGTNQYWELNVAANGNWNVYSFDGYREPAPPKEETRIPQISFYGSMEDESFRLELKIPLGKLGLQNKKLEVSLNSVIEFKNKEKSYYALKHVGEKPDFHQRDSFICNLG